MCAFSPKIPEDDAYLTQKKFTILLIGVHLGPPTGKRVIVHITVSYALSKTLKNSLLAIIDKQVWILQL